jgi:N-methylhydantoinase A
VLSALGLAISDLRRDDVAPWLRPLVDIADEELERAFADLEEAAGADLESPRFQRRADLRYRLQSYELTVEADDLGALAERFAEAHEQRYGYRVDGEPIELVNLRLTTTVAAPKPELHESPATGVPTAHRRRANFDGDWIEVDVLDRTMLGAGSEVVGPAVVEFPESTCVVRPGWRGAVDDAGTLVLRRDVK